MSKSFSAWPDLFTGRPGPKQPCAIEGDHRTRRGFLFAESATAPRSHRDSLFHRASRSSGRKEHGCSSVNRCQRTRLGSTRPSTSRSETRGASDKDGQDIVCDTEGSKEDDPTSIGPQPSSSSSSIGSDRPGADAHPATSCRPLSGVPSYNIGDQPSDCCFPDCTPDGPRTGGQEKRGE